MWPLPTSYFIFGSVYMSMPIYHFPTYPSHSPCPQVHSLHLRLFSFRATRILRTFFFLIHIYVLAYGICFSLSDLLHSVGQTLAPFTSLQITQVRFFIWPSNIPLYICVFVIMDLRYPFICQWTLRLLPCLGYCK